MIDQSGISELLNAVRPDDARTHIATFARTGITVASGRTDSPDFSRRTGAFALPGAPAARGAHWSPNSRLRLADGSDTYIVDKGQIFTQTVHDTFKSSPGSTCPAAAPGS